MKIVSVPFELEHLGDDVIYVVTLLCHIEPEFGGLQKFEAQRTEPPWPRDREELKLLLEDRVLEIEEAAFTTYEGAGE